MRRSGKSKGQTSPPPRRTGPLHSGYEPSAETGFLNTIKELSDVLYSKLFEEVSEEEGTEHGGLVLVTGATNVAKSQVAKALIHIHLERCLGGAVTKSKTRVPHLVTIEDPIESKFSGEPVPDAQVDYTPRQIGIDVEDVRSGIADALRQTPTVLFVGEIRNANDFPLLLEFGGTGHLAISTAHAGTLQEGMDKLLRSANARTPAQRSIVARCLRGMVHLKTCEVDGICGALPSMWRRTAVGEMALVSDGVSSVLPHREDHAFSLGRTWFTEHLTKEPLRTTLRKRALDWDYKGE